MNSTVSLGDGAYFTTRTIYGFVIRLAQRLRWWRQGSFEYNHFGLVVEIDSEGYPWVVQMARHGELTRIDKVAPGGSFTTLPAPDGIDRARAVDYAKKQIGTEYGVTTIFSIAFNLLVPFIRLDFRRNNTLVCSALGARSWEHGGWDCPTDPFQVAPGELYGIQMGFFKNQPLDAPLVNAHAVSRALHETVYTPTHPKRGDSSAEFKASKEALEKETPGCWICGTTDAVLEGHHLGVEWSLINSVDLAKIRETFPQAKSLEDWLDSTENLILLCPEHHRGVGYGVHEITMPAWIVQKYQLEGWDLVNGPNHTSMAALDHDESGYFPEH